jgi:type VI secretion system protein ImpA
MEETMMDPTVIELMSPVSTDNPCGDDLSFSPDFDRIHEARREDDPTLDYGEWESALKQADWKSVVAECESLLKNKTKDMRVAAWLTEGLIKTSGFAGLRRGLEVHVGLLERFGEDIHPRGDDGDQERRIGTMSWFVQRAAHLARSVPLTDSASGRFSLMDYDGAVGLQLQSQRQPDSVPDLDERVTLERFTNAVASTEGRHFAAQLDLINHCSGLVQVFSSLLDAVLGSGAPSIKPLVDSIDAVQTRLLAICKSVGLADTGNAKDELAPGIEASRSALPDALPDTGTAASNPLPLTRALPNGISSRADAVAALQQVAAYFRKAEPHSPVAYLAEKALHWSEMPLHLWLRSVVKDAGVLSHLEEMLGADDNGVGSGA